MTAQLTESLWANADDRLPLGTSGCVEGGDGIFEGRDVADACPQPTIPNPQNELAQLSAIGYHDEIYGQTAIGPCLGRTGDSHQCSSGANHACGPLRNIATENIKNEIDLAYVFQRVVIEIDELLRAKVEYCLAVGGASGTDNIGAGFTRELGRHRTDYASCTMNEDALPCTEAAMLEQPLPRCKARHHKSRAHGKVYIAR